MLAFRCWDGNVTAAKLHDLQKVILQMQKPAVGHQDANVGAQTGKAMLPDTAQPDSLNIILDLFDGVSCDDLLHKVKIFSLFHAMTSSIASVTS